MNSTTEPEAKPYPHCIDGCRFIRNGACGYNAMHTPTIAVDFDRVIFTHDHWQGHQHYGDPIPGVKEALAEFRRMGFKVMIWTTRDQRDIIKTALDLHGIPFDYINHNPNQPPEINPGKPVADYYIDDRAVRFTSWDAVMREIKEREIIDGYYRTPQAMVDEIQSRFALKYPFSDHDIEILREAGIDRDFKGFDQYVNLIKQRMSLGKTLETLKERIVMLDSHGQHPEKQDLIALRDVLKEIEKITAEVLN